MVINRKNLWFYRHLWMYTFMSISRYVFHIHAAVLPRLYNGQKPKNKVLQA